MASECIAGQVPVRNPTNHCKINFNLLSVFSENYEMAQFVETLRYKSVLAGLIPNGVFVILQKLNPSNRTMAVASAQFIMRDLLWW